MFHHASDAFPNHLMLVVEIATLVLWVLLCTVRPLTVCGWVRTFDRGSRRLAAKPLRSLFWLALGTMVASAATTAYFGAPVAQVRDEQSYLLAADTFSAGRISNPPHPLWPHFEALYVLQEPVYMSKYPPAQGAILALGQRLEHPVVGLWISAGLLTGVVGWMLLAWLPPSWALFGALIVALRLGVGSYWNQTYWGGSLAAVGGALVYGALRRLVDRPRATQAALVAVGLVVLANSRPYEGAVAALPAAGILAVWVWRQRRRLAHLGLVLVPLLAILGGAGAAMLSYNARLTGDALLFPNMYDGRQIPSPLFVWQPLNDVVPNRHQEIADFWRQHSARIPQWPGTLSGHLRRLVSRIEASVGFFLGLGLSAGLVMVPWSSRDRWMQLAMTVCVAVALAAWAVNPYHPHYVAPVLGPLLVLALQGLRYFQTRRVGSVRLGSVMALGILASTLAVTLFQLTAHRPDATDWSVRRQRIEADLSKLPGPGQVVIVPYPTHTAGQWIANRADIDAAKVIWARDMGREGNRDLLEYFSGRTFWTLIPGRDGQLVVVHYDEASDQRAAERSIE
jgi:hypothetical protein